MSEHYSHHNLEILEVVVESWYVEGFGFRGNTGDCFIKHTSKVRSGNLVQAELTILDGAGKEIKMLQTQFIKFMNQVNIPEDLKKLGYVKIGTQYDYEIWPVRQLNGIGIRVCPPSYKDMSDNWRYYRKMVDVKDIDCMDQVVAALTAIWMTVAGIKVPKVNYPDSGNPYTSCQWCKSCRFLKGSDTYEGDSNADLASRSTSDMKDLGQFQEGWLCAFTGKVEQGSHLRVANDEFKFENNRAAKITRTMGQDVACNCHRYVFRGDIQANKKAWLTPPGAHRVTILDVNKIWTTMTAGYSISFTHNPQ